MAAPLRRVFSKQFSLLHDHAARMSAVQFCVRCSRPHCSTILNTRPSTERLICCFSGLSNKQSWPKSNHWPPVTFQVGTRSNPFSSGKLSYRHKCNHEHIYRNNISTKGKIYGHKCLSSYNPHGQHNTRNTAVTNLSNSLDSDTDSRRHKSDVLCNNKSNDTDKEPHRLKVLSSKENIYTIPNLLTLGRMLSAPFLGYMVMNEYFEGALALFAFAGVSDLLDGYIARNFKNQNSILGSALDPMADKILISVLTLTLTAVNLIPVPLTALIVGRDLGLIAASFYLRYISLPPPKTVSRYFDVTLVSAKLEPFTVSKWNTAFQLSLVALTLAAPVFQYVDHPFLQGLWYLTGATTFISGLQYVLFWKDSVKILQPERKK